MIIIYVPVPGGSGVTELSLGHLICLFCSLFCFGNFCRGVALFYLLCFAVFRRCGLPPGPFEVS